MLRIVCLIAVQTLLARPAFAEESDSAIAERSTHRQTQIIKMPSGDKLQLNAFCLNDDGHIVAVCGNGPGEVRVINDAGEILNSWPTGVKPEAVAVNGAGEVIVGGGGKLFRFDATGKELQQSEAPHALSLRTDTRTLRKAAIRQLKARNSRNVLASRIAVYERVLQQLEDKGKRTDLNEQEMRMLELIPTNLEKFREKAVKEDEESGESRGPTEQQIQSYIQSVVQLRLEISSISSRGDHVFLATQAAVGFGYEVWRTNRDFSGGEKVITGLSGCCGQMDVQCCRSGVFVAENSRHRVVRYDTDGKELTKWGTSDRDAVDGFSGCCNPMNVCFNSDGDVFTAESTTGRIKRFRPDGEFVSIVGSVKLAAGCKNVSIAASPAADKVYVLDLTRNQIVLLQQKSAVESPAESERDSP